MTLAMLGLVSGLLTGANDVTIAVPAFSATAEVPAAKANYLLEYFSERLAALGGVTVTTSSQIAAVLGIERQRELLGCSDGSSACTAELAGALGVEVVIVGSVAKVGDSFGVTLKAIDAKTSKLLASTSATAAKEEALLEFLAQAAVGLHTDLLQKLRGSAPARAGSGRLRPVVWGVPGALGVISIAVSGGLFFGVVKGAEGRLNSGDVTVGDRSAAHQLATSASTAQTVSAVLLGVGVAAIATAVVLFFVTGEPAAKSVRVALSGFGAGVGSVRW